MIDLSACRSYVSRTFAEKRAKFALDLDAQGISYAISANTEGRFCIVAMLRPDQFVMARSLADAGCYVFG